MARNPGLAGAVIVPALIGLVYVWLMAGPGGLLLYWVIRLVTQARRRQQPQEV